MWNPVKWIKDIIEERKYRKELKKKLEEMAKKDPFIYD